MENVILKDISDIDKGLENLHSEGAKLRAMQQQNKDDIDRRNAGVEAEYTSTLARLDESDRTIESDYQRQITSGTNAENRAESNYKSAVTKNSNAIRAKYDTITRRDKEYIADLENKCRIAAKNNDKLLQKYGTIPSVCTVKPDLTALFILFDKIMTDTAESFIKRTLKKDGFYSQDSMVQDFIQGAAKAIAYLNYEITVIIPQDCNAELQQAINAAQASRQGAISSASSSKASAVHTRSILLAENEQKRKDAEFKRQHDLADVKRLEQQYIVEENAKITDARRRKDLFFEKDLITGFTARATQALRDSGALDVDWSRYTIDRSISTYFSWGDMHVPIHTESKPLQELLKAKIPTYARGGYFAVPLLVQTGTTRKMYIHYDIATKSAVYGNIQAYILQKLRSNPANHLQVYFADPNDRGQNLGVLIAPNDKNEQIGIFAKNTQEEISFVLKEIEAYIDATNGVIGNCKSIFEFNAKHETKLKEMVIVLCDVQNCVSHNDIARLKVIWENAERYGINLILTSETPVDRIEQCYENKNTDLSFLRQRSASTVFYDSIKRAIAWGNESYSYTPTTISDAHKKFISNYREQIVESLKLNNKFADIRNRMQVDYANDRQRELGKSVDSVKLPVLINTNTNKIDTDFEIGTSNDVHMLVTGGTGSGKSRFLFSIISSIAMNYHPDDVELWLIDCKINEFKPFIDRYRLPHIKLVALERTEEFCRAFFKYLSEVVAERVKLFGKMGKKSFDEYRAAMGDPYCMPRIIIIVDEFHALIQVLNDDRKLKLEMENALAEYRSYGISFIFSDQSYEKITMSLQQVNCRIALRGDVENMKQTLRLKSDYSQQLISDFEQSEGKGDAWWGKKVPTRFKNVFISETQEQAFFEEMANKWNPQVRHPKQPIFIDGAKRYPYDETTAMYAIREKQARLDEFDDYQMDLVLGQPTTFEPYFSVCLKQGRRENLLLLGENEMSVDVIGAIIKSLQYNGPVRIIAMGDRSDRNFKKFRRYVTNNSLDNVEIYHEYEDICDVVYELNQKVQSKKEFRTKAVVFWFALNNLCEEFGDFPQLRKEPQQTTPIAPAPSLPNTFSEAEKNQFLAVAEELSTGDDDFDLSGLFQLVEPEPQVATQKTVVDSEDSLYNAGDDILTLFATGSRFGLFNVVMLENPSDESKIKGATKRWDMEQFKHRIGFCMPRANANSWNITEASLLEEDLTALYSDGIKKTVFKPYFTVNKEEKV